MYILETVTGFVGGIIFLLTTVLAYKAHKNFEENEELAATKIFLKNSITRSLQVQVIGTLFFGITGLTSLLTIVNNGNSVFANAYRLGSIVLFMTFLYMIYNIESATKPQSKEDTDDNSVLSIKFD